MAPHDEGTARPGPPPSVAASTHGARGRLLVPSGRGGFSLPDRDESECAMTSHVKIFDTTLRDGEQSPGISLDVAEKLEIAEQLARLGVDVIEAGFPVASTGDFEAVEAVARAVRGPVICGLSRTNLADVDRCWEAVRHAEKARIHV